MLSIQCLLFVFVAASLSICEALPNVVGSIDAVNEILSFRDFWIESYNSGNISAIAKRRHNESWYMAEGQSKVTSIHAYEIGFKEDIASKVGAVVQIVFTDVFMLNEDFAFGHNMFNDGIKLGSSSLIFKKENGSWCVYRDIFNTIPFLE